MNHASCRLSIRFAICMKGRGLSLAFCGSSGSSPISRSQNSGHSSSSESLFQTQNKAMAVSSITGSTMTKIRVHEVRRYHGFIESRLPWETEDWEDVALIVCPCERQCFAVKPTA